VVQELGYLRASVRAIKLEQLAKTSDPVHVLEWDMGIANPTSLWARWLALRPVRRRTEPADLRTAFGIEAWLGSGEHGKPTGLEGVASQACSHWHWWTLTRR